VGGCSGCGDGPEDCYCGGGEVDHRGGSIRVDGVARLESGDGQDQGVWNATLLLNGRLAMIIRTLRP
jgi:hypothetical protein